MAVDSRPLSVVNDCILFFEILSIRIYENDVLKHHLKFIKRTYLQKEINYEPTTF